MKQIILTTVLFLLMGCGKQNSQDAIISKTTKEFDFEALKDTLNLMHKEQFIPVKEISPYYIDNNPYKFPSEERLKTCYYWINPETNDTVLYGVLRDNSFVLWGINDVKELIEYTIKNRDHL